MPRRDGSGPMGTGSMTGKGLGLCADDNVEKHGPGPDVGLGLACRRGFGRGFGRGSAVKQTSKTQKELLHEHKTILQKRLEDIDKQLETYSGHQG